MPVEDKPLFRPDVVRPYLTSFDLPGRVATARPKLHNWAALLESSRADRLNEQELLPDFLSDIFIGLLGYTRPADHHERYTFTREHHVEVDGKRADAVLGEFNGAKRYVVAVEGKGPRDPLDRPYAGRRMSAVDQGYRYAINLRCDWIIVTSIRQTRLYHKGSDQQTYERFDTQALAHDENTLARFVYLLGADRVVPEAGDCHLPALLAESEKKGRDLTKAFYVRYGDIRQDAFEQLSRDNPQVARRDALACTQKMLDRVLFIAFSEDRGLLPPNTIQKAYEQRNPYRPEPIWSNFLGLFDSINTGNRELRIHAYNGGLFASDSVLDGLTVSDGVCEYFRELGGYDYRPAHQAATGDDAGSLIDVDILGHIFEQSITDLERLRAPAADEADPRARRKREGAFYTPAFITRFIVEQALGGVLRERFELLRQKHATASKAAARKALANPQVYLLDRIKKPERAALAEFWDDWRELLRTIRVVDPACGSGAFLIEAFDQLHRAFIEANARLDELRELRGQATMFDLNRQILQHNLFGVDLNEEAIEICRLSLWIKTAESDKALTSLDHSIRVGNSIVADPTHCAQAFDWRAAFPEIFATGGFDVVIGNPPYVRQELLSAIKPYLEANYQTYHGMADLYVYFYELGIRLLKPGGLMSLIVTNKWMKAGYGEPLRRFLRENAWVESVVDFGHAKQIFEDADVFPSILVARKPDQSPAPTTARLCAIPREQLRIDDLSRQISEEGVELPLAQLGADSWQLEATGVSKLLKRITSKCLPLAEYSGIQPLYGVKTGCNEAFIIDSPTRDRLIAADFRSAEIIKKCLRGQDATRWMPDWVGTWIIFARRGIDIDQYPAVLEYLAGFRDRLEPKPRGHVGVWKGRASTGHKWYELSMPLEYWQQFERPKIVYPDITWQAQFSMDSESLYPNNTMYFLPTDDIWLLSILNSPIGWWYAWRGAQHGKDEALRYFTTFVESFPVPLATAQQIAANSEYAMRLREIATRAHQSKRGILDWLCVEHEIEKPSKKLLAATELDCDEWVAEVRKLRGRRRPLSAAGLASLRDEWQRTIAPARERAAEALVLERRISDLVNKAYGLTPEEVDLMWETAPPRMPFARA